MFSVPLWLEPFSAAQRAGQQLMKIIPARLALDAEAARIVRAAPQAALHLSEYRKLEPGRFEEMFFFDHPSGHTRIFNAMRWKAEHPESASSEEMNRQIFEKK